MTQEKEKRKKKQRYNFFFFFQKERKAKHQKVKTKLSAGGEMENWKKSIRKKVRTSKTVKIKVFINHIADGKLRIAFSLRNYFIYNNYI